MIDELNDYELVYLAQEHNEDAINLLYDKYYPLMDKLSRSYYKKLKYDGLEFDDLLLECRIGFDQAIDYYSDKKDSSFYTFVIYCMENRLISLIRKEFSGKTRILNEAISLDSCMDSNSDCLLIDCIDSYQYHPEDELLRKEECKDLYQRILKQLSRFEECVFALRMNQLSYRDIAILLNKDEKSIYNTMQRVKNKINIAYERSL